MIGAAQWRIYGQGVAKELPGLRAASDSSP